MQIVTFLNRRIRKSALVVGVAGEDSIEQIKFVLPEYERAMVILKLQGFGSYNKT